MTATFPELDHGRILVSVDEIRPSRKNDLLYKPVRSDDPQTIELAESIRKHGILEPLVLTADSVILSGHRRYAAAKLAGLMEVPCQYVVTISTDRSFVRLLREHNRQRDKTLDERLRESIVEQDPRSAFLALVEHRQKASAISADRVQLNSRRERAKISPAKQPLLDAILEIIEGRRKFWPLSDRGIHYPLLNFRPLIHASKPDSVYANTLKSYKACVDLLTRARLVGLIPMEAIDDETRPVTVWQTKQNAGQFIGHELSQFAKGYWRDLMQSQPNHVEILVEKNTVAPIVKTIAERYTIPMTSGRGFCSIPPRQAMLERFKKSGKTHLVLIVASDFDPEGESICESFGRSMRDDFGCSIRCVKAALTFEQTQTMNLPPALELKENGAGKGRSVGFKKKYGTDVYELEALSPETLQRLVDEAVRSVIDIDLLNAELTKERDESVWLDVTRRRLSQAMAEISLDKYKKSLGRSESTGLLSFSTRLARANSTQHNDANHTDGLDNIQWGFSLKNGIPRLAHYANQDQIKEPRHDIQGRMAASGVKRSRAD